MLSPTYTLSEIFGAERRLAVPLFQRRYVWSRERQWDRLWEDILAVADAFCAAGSEEKEKLVKPHFLGAVVLDGASQSMDDVQVWQIIDGQQRLTTSQIMLEAFSDLCREYGAQDHHKNMLKLTRIDNSLIKDPDGIFKLWPTTADQEHFRRVMLVKTAAELCRQYGLDESSETVNDAIADAYLFFYRRMEAWLRPKEPDFEARVAALYKTLRRGIRFVTIELDDKDDPQVIFETLNAHGTPLLVADLVKNLLFHRVRGDRAQINKLYADYWKQFDDDKDFWSAKVGRGVAARETIDVFLQYFVAARTRQDVQVGRLFAAFREYALKEGANDARVHLADLRRYADAFKLARKSAKDTRAGQFYERLEQLETGAAYPLVLELVVNGNLKAAELQRCLLDIESFLVRRMVCGLTTKHYNKYFVEAMGKIGSGPGTADRLREFLLGGEGDTVRWPNDAELAPQWTYIPIYKKARRKRTAMILEALDKQLYDPKSEVVTHTKELQVEHLMPRKWKKHWPLPNTEGAEEKRDELMHTIGNLTLVTGKLNSKISNGPWEEKRRAISKHGSLALNRELAEEPTWNEEMIPARAMRLLQVACRIWPHPNGTIMKGQ